eukprot:TRINITY_DN8086_c0_g1_i1.p1 TRINITY_DN8086_c0_g1~~TRINITY_DN8086_c0_g1_i1.p1  ORF type:complete len:273 (+),score=44.68 TRINITY_DN8086_c0_g1_i1:82-819(+)
MQGLRRTLAVLTTIIAIAAAKGPEISSPTSAPTAAPTSAPTSGPTPIDNGKPSVTQPSTTAKPASSTTPAAAVPMTKITFGISLQTSATCSDMAAGSTLYAAMQKAGAQLAGGVAADAVKVVCASSRRLLGGRRLASLNVDFEVTVPTTDATAAETALAAVDLATATSVFETAATDSGAGITFTVSESALTNMKASVASEEIPVPGANTTTATTTRAAAPGAASNASHMTCFVGVATAFMLVAFF